MSSHLQLSFDLADRDPAHVEEAALACGASAVTFVDGGDDPVLEPAPGEMPLWHTTRVQCLFNAPQDIAALKRTLAAALGIDCAAIEASAVAERVWEREWLRHFHALRFGRRLWICPHHEQVTEPDAVIVKLDPGLAFGTGTHPSTALCLEWLDTHLPGPPPPAEHSEAKGAQGLDTHLPGPPPPAEHSEAKGAQGLDTHLPGPPPPADHGARIIDYGCGSGVLALAALKLGAGEAHCFDIDPQALTATAANAEANGIAPRVRVHDSADTLPAGADLLLANILAGPLCTLAARFATLVRPGGTLVLAGLMTHQAAEVTEAHAACFDVICFGEREGWAGLAGRRR